jgi:hypothetical protein
MTRVFVDWPVYSPASNGIRCLYEISFELAEKGFNVTGIPRNMKKHVRSLANLPSRFKAIPVMPQPLGSAKDVLIASETAPRSTVLAARKNNLRIAWWQLAPYQLLGGTFYPKPGEFNMAFSSYADPEASRFFYYQPLPDKDWENAINSPTLTTNPEQTFLVYSGKGRLTTLPKPILDACEQSRIEAITRFSPQTKQELFRVMAASHGLISFDELTCLNLEAASIGVPVFIANPAFPPASRERFTIADFANYASTDHATFLRLVQERVEGRQNRIKSDELTSQNRETIAMLATVISNGDTAQAFRVSEKDIRRFRSHTQSLKKARAIYPHLGGQAGGSIFLNAYVRNIDRGRHETLVQIGIRCLDSAYRYLRFPLSPVTHQANRITKLASKVAHRLKPLLHFKLARPKKRS